jgi:2-desacetyl-2-hydroxyethyl bacteriochlorophyllide A dehydrogenase
MEARALITTERQEFSLQPVTLTDPGPDEVLVRTLWSGVSIGTEFALIRAKLVWGPYPLCTGYQAVGVIEYAGGNVEGFAVGDRVYYRENRPMTLSDGTSVSAVSGTHCSRAVINPRTTHGMAHLPEGAPEDAASLFVMPAVGLHGVDLSQVRLGWKVVVYGVGLIGLGVVAHCAARGCEVIAVDLDDYRLNVARRLGADHMINAMKQDYRAEVLRIAPGGADAVFETTGLPEMVMPTIELCRERGTFVWQGNYGKDPFPFSFLTPHGKRLTMVFPCDDGYIPSRRSVVKGMALGTLPWAETITHRVEAKDAPALYAGINEKRLNVLGAVIRWAAS